MNNVWSIQNDCVCLPNGRAILNIDAIGGEDEAEVKANIAVIVAAPELLAALKVSLNMLNQLLKAAEQGTVPDISIGFFKNRTQIIEPAIASATKA